MRLADLKPGWRSDFILHRGVAEIEEKSDCIVVRTPSNPHYYWGNCLLLPQAPGDDELLHWRARFAEEIGLRQPGSRHTAIGINAAPRGEKLPSWRRDGFEALEMAVLELNPGGLKEPVRPARGRVECRPVDLEREIELLVAMQCADNVGYEPVAYEAFRRQLMRRYATMAAAGDAAWFVLWCDGVPAADCGLMRDAELGRFQRVSTQPAWRRRGLCTALIAEVTAWGIANWNLQRVLMCADPGDVAIGIYESLGYRRIDSEWCLQRYAPEDEGARRPAGT